MMTRWQFSQKVYLILLHITQFYLLVTVKGAVGTRTGEIFDFFKQPHVNDEEFGKEHQYPKLKVPWNVLIKNGQKGSFMRGGALLSDNFLLTFGRAQDWGRNNLEIEFGANHGKQVSDFKSIVEEIFPHGNNSEKTSLTLMKLKNPLTFTDDIYSAYLPIDVSKEEILGVKAVLTGHRISNSSTSTGLIQGALVETVKCVELNKGEKRTTHQKEGILCISCERIFFGGDKGDPMVYNGIRGATLLAMGNGVVDCTVGATFEFIDITHYMDWINKTMKSNV